MSRIGKKPIPIPKGVTVKIEGNTVMVQGPKGKLDTPLPSGITMEQKDGNLIAIRPDDAHSAVHGLARALVNNAVDAKLTKLTLNGIDRQKVGQVAAEMRSLRPPDPYKNKGVRYSDERLKKKVGKTGAK